MEPQVIRTETEYNSAMKEIENLMELDPEENTSEFKKLDLLSFLVATYEKDKFLVGSPDPITAIRFRMEQANLNQSDLIEYLGSKGRVSEVLAGKRPLTVKMINALHKGLGIPLKSLIGTDENSHDSEEVEWSFSNPKKYARAIQKMNWISLPEDSRDLDPMQIIHSFMAPLENNQSILALRRSSASGTNESEVAFVFLWLSKVAIEGSRKRCPYEFNPNNSNIAKEISVFSSLDNGPLLVKDFLWKQGVILVFVRQFPNMKTDGACMFLKSGNPVIGMTLRHDRLDSFWFTLAHELAHVYRHLSKSKSPFVDDIENLDLKDTLEKEADRFAAETYIPPGKLRTSNALNRRTEKDVVEFARNLGISPAIVAGRIRHQLKDYRIFNNLIGLGMPRKIVSYDG